MVKKWIRFFTFRKPSKITYFYKLYLEKSLPLRFQETSRYFLKKLWKKRYCVIASLLKKLVIKKHINNKIYAYYINE